MVQRTSEALNIPDRPVFGDVQQVQTKQVAPGGDTEIGDGGQAATERLVQGLFRDVAQLAGQGFQTATQEAYLAGQAKAGQIESEEMLESHPLTRQWAVAGYRDATGRLKIADAQVKLAEDMKWLRQGSPESMNQYLAERRKGLEPMFAGMSREARASAFASLLLEDRSAVATHTSEHAKYINEVEMKSFAAQASSVARSMHDAVRSNQPSVLRTANEQGAAMIYTVMANTRLSSEQKIEFVSGFTQGRLAEGNTSFYSYLRDTPVPMALGGAETRPLLSFLPEKTQEELSKAHLAAESKTNKLRNAAMLEEHAGYMNQREAGTYALTYAEAQAIGRRNMRDDALQWSGEQHDAWMQGHLKYHASKQHSAEWADMYLRGDIQGILNSGGTENEAKKAFLDSDIIKNSTGAGVLNLLSIAGNNGMATGRKAAGELGNTAVVNLLSPEGKVLPQHMETVQQLNALMDGYAATPHMQTELLSGMDPEARDDFLTHRALLRAGRSVEQAGADLFERRKLLTGLSKGERAIMAEESAKERVKWMQELTSGKDNFDRLYQGVKFWQPNSTALGANATWFSNESNNAFILAKNRETMVGAVAETANRLARAHPLMPAKDLQAATEAEILRRTVVTPHAPLVVPDGQTPQTFFGVQESQEQIGKAIYKMLPAQTPGGRMVFRIARGELLWQEYAADGSPTRYTGAVKPDIVKAGLKSMEDERVTKFSAHSGAGVTLTDNVSQARVWVDGSNAAGVKPEDMLEFRKDMVKFEGIRLKAYKDHKGNMTIGVGANMKYAFGDLPQAQRPVEIDEKTAGRILKANSETAARAARKVMTTYKLRGQDAFRLVADFAFKSGSAGLQTFSEYRAFFESRDAATALKNLKLTPAYQSSGKERQAHYEALLTSMMKGM